MQVIAVASREASVGKTTLAAHIAVQAERTGYGPVALLDADPRGHLAQWWNRRTARRPAFVNSTLGRLEADIGTIRHLGFTLLVIDTPPDMASGPGPVMDLADLIVVPVHPGGKGLPDDGIGVFAKPVVLVANGVTPKARISVDDAVALSQYGALAPSVIQKRDEISTSMERGETMSEAATTTRSVDDIRELWSYLANRLARMRNVGTTQPVPISGIGAGSDVSPGTAPLAGKGGARPLSLGEENSRNPSRARLTEHPGASDRSTVLVLALDPYNAKVYHDLLEVHGYETVVTQNIDDWQKALDSCAPDLIIVELCASDHPSIGIARDIGRDARFSATPIICVTDTLETNDRGNPVSADCNCDGHIAKPISIPGFYGPIEAILSRGADGRCRPKAESRPSIG